MGTNGRGKSSTKRGKQGDRPSRSLENRATGILEELHALARSMARSEGIQSQRDLPIDEVTIPVTLRLAGIRGGKKDTNEAKRFLRMIRSRIGEAIRGLGTYRHGRAYCFQCDAPDCEHSVPGAADETFIGYTANGRPEWQSMANLCLDIGEQRAELLYGSPPEIIAIVLGAKELTCDLLPGFGKGDKAYNVLGQVVLGLLPTDFSSGPTTSPRTALTLQLVETRSQGMGRRLRLNLFGMSIDYITQMAARSRNRGPAESMRRTIQVTRDRLVELGRKAAIDERRGYPSSFEKDVAPLLSRLRGDLERIFRSGLRRTLHAQERHADRGRPVSLAVKDASRAADEKFLHDADKDTIVVLGPRGRTHVFSRDGRHVTSMVIKAGELDRKFSKTRWKPASQELLSEFRATFSSAPDGG